MYGAVTVTRTVTRGELLGLVVHFPSRCVAKINILGRDRDREYFKEHAQLVAA